MHAYAIHTLGSPLFFYGAEITEREKRNPVNNLFQGENFNFFIR